MEQEITYKKCCKCGEEKPATPEFFYRNITKKDGLTYDCKECRKKENTSPQHRLKRRIYNENYYLNQDNREKKNKSQNKYYHTNKDDIMKKQNDYIKKKYDEDPLYRLYTIIKSSLNYYLEKKDFSTIDYLGCDWETFKEHIESQFTEGMSWDNQGRKEDNYGWELDHIYPASKAKNEEELIKLFHYTNFQPLWKIDNINKSNKVSQ